MATEHLALTDWNTLRAAAEAFCKYDDGQELNDAETVAFHKARDEFHRLATPDAVLSLLDFGSLAAEALLPIADEVGRADAAAAADHSLVASPEVAVRYKAAQARTVVALVDAMRAMQQASADIAGLLHEQAPSATVQALSPWIRHNPPCIVGTSADDGDYPEKCICGLTERLAELAPRVQ